MIAFKTFSFMSQIYLTLLSLSSLGIMVMTVREEEKLSLTDTFLHKILSFVLSASLIGLMLDYSWPDKKVLSLLAAVISGVVGRLFWKRLFSISLSL